MKSKTPGKIDIKNETLIFKRLYVKYLFNFSTINDKPMNSECGE